MYGLDGFSVHRSSSSLQHLFAEWRHEKDLWLHNNWIQGNLRVWQRRASRHSGMTKLCNQCRKSLTCFLLSSHHFLRIFWTEKSGKIPANKLVKPGYFENSSFQTCERKKKTGKVVIRWTKKKAEHKHFALQNCNICKQGSENCQVNLSSWSCHYVIKSSTRDDLNTQWNSEHLYQSLCLHFWCVKVLRHSNMCHIFVNATYSVCCLCQKQCCQIEWLTSWISTFKVALKRERLTMQTVH